MPKQQQLTLDYKLQPPSSRLINTFLLEEEIQEDHTNTPGWTSIAPIESQHSSTAHNEQKYYNILNKLNKLDDIDLANSTYSKVRLGSSGHRISAQNGRINTEERCNKENQSFQRMSFSRNDKETCQQRLKSTRNRTDSRVVTGQSLISQNISTRGGHSRIKTRGNETVRDDSGKKHTKFKNITVHQYLYLDSKKQENKRLIEQVLDEQYKKMNMLTFRPTISQKSQELALIKFSKIQQRQSLEQELQEELRSLSMRLPHHQPSNSQIQKQREQQKYQTLNQFFYLLSQNTKTITKSTLKDVIERIPLVCIKIISKLIEKIYQGKQYSWLQFLGAINDKKIVSNREGLLSVAQKWLSKENKPSDRDTKEDTHAHLYV